MLDDYVDESYNRLTSAKNTKLSGVVEIFNKNLAGYSSKMGITPSSFIDIDGTRYFVKYPTLGQSHKTYEILIELFVSFIAKKIGIDCIDTKILIDHEKKAIGVISPDFGEHITCANFGQAIDYGDRATTVNEIIDRIKSRAQTMDNVNINYDQLTEELNRLCCFDYLTRQYDRHSQNLAFMITEQDGKKELKLAPLYDNANAFLSKTGRHYKLSPNNCRVWGLEEQKLLNSKHSNMLSQFETMFSDNNFNSLMEQFNSIYGVNKLFENEADYLMVVENIKGSVQNQIAYCKNRQKQEEFIPLEAVYAVIQRHNNEIDEDTEWYITRYLDRYYSNKDYDLSYKNFYNETAGEFLKWKWYDESLALAKTPNNPELNSAKEAILAKRREFGKLVISSIVNNKTFSYDEFDERNYILFKDDYFLKHAKKGTRLDSKLDAVYRICNSYKYYLELRNFYKQREDVKESLTKEEQKDLKTTKKMLKKYIKYVNSCTNRKLSKLDIKRLRDCGVEISV